MAITAAEKYLLNRMNSVAQKVQLGTLIENAESALSSIPLAEGNIMVGDSGGAASAVSAKDSGKILVGDGTTVNSVAVSGDATLSSAGALTIGAAKITEAKLLTQALAGLHAHRVAKVVFDPSANAGERTVGAHGLGVTLPAKAVITRAWYKTVTQVAGGAGATVAFHAESANDIFTATDITAQTAGTLHECIPTGTVANMKLLTIAREVTATVAVDALSAGKIDLFIEYVVTD